MPHRGFTFGTKAETLEALALLVSSSHIPRFHYFSVGRWIEDRALVVSDLQERFVHEKVIVRSSARGEDSATASLAGVFDSVPHVLVDNAESLHEAIEKVIESYRLRDQQEKKEHQVLVQRMVEDISMSGVVLTQDLNTGAPYYVINYDDESGRTDTVTGGMENSNRTLLVHRDAVSKLASERFKALLLLIQEVERHTGHDALDIEFAVDRSNAVHLLQVRPIAMKPNWNRGLTLRVNEAIAGMKDFVEEKKRPVVGLAGTSTVFGTMPDWNPAEMIGTSPRQLALSLYRRLITDSAWRVARGQMGYANPPGTRLMIDLYGKPYIDVRVSFNTFLPAGLPHEIATKLVDAWLNRLAEHKELHDKVEFEIVTTVGDFNFTAAVARQFPGVLTIDEQKIYKNALFTLTNSLITGTTDGSLAKALNGIDTLRQRHVALMANTTHSPLYLVSALLEDCLTLGTIPFSIAARHAFIATSFLRSLVARGVLSEDEVLRFKKSIQTVAGQLVADIDHFFAGEMNREHFMQEYGHLRPGTYDITAARYDQRADLLTNIPTVKVTREHAEEFHFNKEQLSGMAQLIKEAGYTITPEALIEYMEKAIAGREYAKFAFTHNVSDVLECIATWGEKIGLSREELSYISIDDILDAMTVAHGTSLESDMRKISQAGKEAHELTLAIRLPYLIERPEDVSIVPLLINKPNFITKKSRVGPGLYLQGHAAVHGDMTGKIILIESADPGFDWIFAHPIAGLITKYGGANSHMAIRCAEFGLPAAIGCGEQIFDRIVTAQSVYINCSDETLEASHL